MCGKHISELHFEAQYKKLEIFEKDLIKIRAHLEIDSSCWC